MNGRIAETIERNGFAGPFRAFSEEQIASIGETIERCVLTSEGPAAGQPVQSRHLDSQDVLALCTRQEIVERVAALLGPDIVLWRSNFFPKTPGAAELHWHRDAPHWGSILTPMINVSAWLAIDPSTRMNGCVRVIAGSHRRQYTATGEDEKFVTVDAGEAREAVPMELAPGEFFIFNQDLVHSSSANVSQARRLGLAIRYTLPSVVVNHEAIFPGHRSIPLHVENAKASVL
ncbi:MAG: phytanoyl-CoA dioxygenase family protein [Candidatus Eremiobacteraeota bacterium]|nr:phytanoyl-CoA dioxygenase family protein [Candidatus Eremiobacteraeota bacterium]